jgi:hypothetical protein
LEGAKSNPDSKKKSLVPMLANATISYDIEEGSEAKGRSKEFEPTLGALKIREVSPDRVEGGKPEP